MTFGEMITNLRKNKGYTLEQLSNKSGITIANLSLIENDKQKPKIVTLSKLANALECSYDELYNAVYK